MGHHSSGSSGGPMVEDNSSSEPVMEVNEPGSQGEEPASNDKTSPAAIVEEPETPAKVKEPGTSTKAEKPTTPANSKEPMTPATTEEPPSPAKAKEPATPSIV